MPIDLYAEHAKFKFRLPSNWKVYKWECFPKIGDTIYVAVTGAVCDAVMPDGNTDWDQMDKSTIQTLNLFCAEHDAWKMQWEMLTGKCSRCTGEGKVVAKWSAKTGTEYRPCPKCNP
jgi:hypothetical protein